MGGGNVSELDRLTNQLKVMYQADPLTSPEDESSLIQHSASIMIVNPEGKYQAVFTEPLNPHLMAYAITSLKEKTTH
jgi:cytochrome oxidase Cu insertion factor (SCO1/SenC/PrrC family)